MYMHACCLHAQLFNASTIQHAHDIPLGGSGISVTSAVPPSLGSTFSQSDSGILSDALMAAELSSYFCLLVSAVLTTVFCLSADQFLRCSCRVQRPLFEGRPCVQRPLLFGIGLVAVTYRCILFFGTLDSALGLHV